MLVTVLIPVELNPTGSIKMQFVSVSLMILIEVEVPIPIERFGSATILTVSPSVRLCDVDTET